MATIPATVYELASTRGLVAPASGNGSFITAGERDALRYLARAPQLGGVMTRFYLGSVVPGATGRRTYVGDCLWSQPDCTPRAQTVQKLFDGSLSPVLARGLVRRSRARFLLADCQSEADLRKILLPMIRSVHRFGCAGVYALR